jgi:hypothetical protein
MGIDSESSLGDIAKAIIADNLAHYHVCDLSDGWEIVLAPIWEPFDGHAGRRASLQPRSMREHYFEGPARELLESEHIQYVVAAAFQSDDRIGQIVGELRALYCSDDAPYFPLDVAGEPTIAVVSAVIADAARKARVGMTAAEIIADYNGTPSPKLEMLEMIEGAFMENVADAPVEELVAALAKQKNLRTPE